MNLKVTANVASLCGRKMVAVRHIPHVKISIFDSFLPQRWYCNTRWTRWQVMRSGAAHTRAAPLIQRRGCIAIAHWGCRSICAAIRRTGRDFRHVVYRFLRLWGSSRSRRNDRGTWSGHDEDRLEAAGVQRQLGLNNPSPSATC